MPAPDQPILGAKYRLIRQLDEGGMGSVWLAEHLSLHSPVAVKLISAEVAATDEGVQRFLREARAAASLRSPHVVQILDYGVHQGTPYIVMELLDGESLADRLDRVRGLSLADTERILRQVCRAVARAHDAGIVHRDLKPANIFISSNEDEEVVKLLDFGIAKDAVDTLGADLLTSTRSGIFLGTPTYASPEQAQGITTLDHRADIWSLGVIAFECVTGCQPFMGDTFAHLVLAICSRPLPVPSRYGVLPPEFDAWFARACARDVDERFQSVREAAAALRRIVEAPAVSGYPLPSDSPGALLFAAELPLRHSGAAPPAEMLSSWPASRAGMTTAVASSAAVTRRMPVRSNRRWLALASLGGLALVVAAVGLHGRSSVMDGGSARPLAPAAAPDAAAAPVTAAAPAPAAAAAPALHHEVPRAPARPRIAPVHTPVALPPAPPPSGERAKPTPAPTARPGVDPKPLRKTAVPQAPAAKPATPAPALPAKKPPSAARVNLGI